MYSAIALFCDDIREEKSGKVTLVGILPDNVNVTSLPAAFPKLGVYLRVSIPTEGDGPKAISFWLTSPDPLSLGPTPFDAALVERARQEAKVRGAANGGIITQAVISPLQIKTAGRINVHVKIDDQEYIAGTLNVQLGPKPS